MRYLKLHRLISGARFKSLNNLAAGRLDSRGDGPAAALIMQMIEDAPAEFIEWAIDAVIHWKPTVGGFTDIVHTHGTKDALFPFSRIRKQ